MDSKAIDLLAIERLGTLTVLRFHWRGVPAGADPAGTEALWDFLEREKNQPSNVLLVYFTPELVGPASLEMLTGSELPTSMGDRWSTEPLRRRRMVREENVLRRCVEEIRKLSTYVVGVVLGEVALQRTAPYLACDYRVAAEDTTFVNTLQQFPVAPTAGLPWFLARLLGPARASQILLESTELSAQEARGLGLVNSLVPSDTLEQKTLDVARKFDAMPRAALVTVKRAIVASCEDLSTYLDREAVLVRQFSESY